MSFLVNRVMNSRRNVKGYLFNTFIIMSFTCWLLVTCFDDSELKCLHDNSTYYLAVRYPFEVCPGFDKSNVIVHLEKLRQLYEKCSERDRFLNGTITIDKDIEGPITVDFIVLSQLIHTSGIPFIHFTNDDICENLDEGYIWHSTLASANITECPIKAGAYPFWKPALIDQHDVELTDDIAYERGYYAIINMTGIVDNKKRTLGCFRKYIPIDI